MDYLVSCNHLVKIVKVYMLPFCGEIKMNNIRYVITGDGLLPADNIPSARWAEAHKVSGRCSFSDVA